MNEAALKQHYASVSQRLGLAPARPRRMSLVPPRPEMPVPGPPPIDFALFGLAFLARYVEVRCDVPRGEVASPGKRFIHREARTLFAYLAHTHTRMAFSRIAKFMHMRDHTSAMYLVGLYCADHPETAATIKALRRNRGKEGAL